MLGMVRQTGLALVLALIAGSGCATIGSRGNTVIIVVKKDDTLNSLAKKYDTDWKSIAALNRDQLVDNRIHIGQELTVKFGPGAANLIQRETAEETASDDQGDDEDSEFLSSRKKGLLYGSRPSEPTELIYPVEGGISSHFGKRGRRQHKGIDIIANVGTPIIASGDGEVIFSGRQHGYGNTVVVDHGQFMTLYAHASKLIAKRHDKVHQGDFIAKVGRTGNARGAHLHFEIRNTDNKPVDPEIYLRHKTVAQVRPVAPVSVAMAGLPAKQHAKHSKKFAANRATNPKKSLVKHSRPQRGKRGLLYVKD